AKLSCRLLLFHFASSIYSQAIALLITKILIHSPTCIIQEKNQYRLILHLTVPFHFRTQNEGHPKWFVLGVGQVIKGLDIAMMNMCPGEKRKVTIPPSLAYGQQGYAQGKIPPNATLVFEIELYAVNKGPRSVEAFNQIDKDGDKKLSELEISQYLKEEFARDGKKRHPSAHDEILADIFKKNDHDGDGFISAKEYNVYQHDEL
uniref:peptidylprolyl isomerase n=1 Tax=Cyanistes caeruleus TaxID=156563 RepID=A0A8C0VV11_CYACU